MSLKHVGTVTPSLERVPRSLQIELATLALTRLRIVRSSKAVYTICGYDYTPIRVITINLVDALARTGFLAYQTNVKGQPDSYIVSRSFIDEAEKLRLIEPFEADAWRAAHKGWRFDKPC